jgi:hypothetical protein
VEKQNQLAYLKTLRSAAVAAGDRQRVAELQLSIEELMGLRTPRLEETVEVPAERAVSRRRR